MAYTGSDDRAIHFTKDDENPNEEPDNAYQESVYISFVDHEKGIGGVWRTGLEHNQGKANVCATLWRENATSYNYFYRHHKLPKADWSNMQAGPTTISVVDPWKKVHAVLKDDEAGIEAELEWNARTPAFDFKKDTPEQLIGAFREHYQQFGDFECKVKWGSEKFTISGTCFRDHSWGVREWERGWKFVITGGVLREKDLLYVMMGHRQGRMNGEGVVLSHFDPEKDTRVKYHISDFRAVFDPPPIVTAQSYVLNTPDHDFRVWGRAVAPTLVMPFGKAHFTTALYKWDVDGETVYGITDNFAGHHFAHNSYPFPMQGGDGSTGAAL